MTTLTRRFLLAFHCQITCLPQKRQPGAFLVRNWDHHAAIRVCPFSTRRASNHQRCDDTQYGDNAQYGHDKNKSNKNKGKRYRKSEIRERDWNRRFEDVKAYADEMRKKYPNDKYIPFPPRDYKLYFWFTNQRHWYQRTLVGEYDESNNFKAMPVERMQKLESLGFMLTPRYDYWDLRFEQLVEFLKENNGRFPYEMDYEQFNEEEQRLYWWCQNQKKRYSLYHRGELEGVQVLTIPGGWSPERERRLDEIGFCWNTKEAQWDARFEELKAYRAHHGNCLVPAYYAPNKPLATWVSEQRHHYKLMKQGKRSSMTAERVELLESIEFAWDSNHARWLMKYEELEEHVDLNGPGILPPSMSSQRRWLDRQLQLLKEMREGKQNSMTEERAQFLAKLGYAK